MGIFFNRSKDRINSAFCREGFNLFAVVYSGLKIKIRRFYYKKLFGWDVRSILGPAYIRGKSHITIGQNFSCRTNLWLEAVTTFNQQNFSPRINIGNNVGASDFLHIAATNSIRIGNNVLIGSKVLITDHLHGDYRGLHPSSPEISPHDRPLSSDLAVTIEDNVLIGDNVSVLPGVNIGFGAVIGANSVVTSDIPAWTIAAGVPAKVLKKFDSIEKKWMTV
ncbi:MULTISPECIES: DapH/DapD/GlmU-related protein [unclassified Janthinobacterium]|uniref:DapH/DapD/GlmU-related protein n=1 Tax=unclassified Janthinobacterium TaxID=2610881 RepID=UPI00160C47B9|nr:MULTISPECIES: DapH/DapD/GlmU-related protein [unclassified Janthinobacterium]MBB5608601.1 lipopolysaccharide O-acetyltransferase [Janthinobacterium sp. S3T4]MBB5614122.1 lipopolysaccharide O-acetyltransferase [Janthinobacterium sp. S3M3]